MSQRGLLTVWRIIEKLRVFLLGHHYPCRRVACYRCQIREWP
jgi:hypothetical protein